MNGVYAWVRPGRAGLGNMLFPWARAVIFAERHTLPILSVQWTQPKIGPLLRGERDKRLYTGLFTSQGYIRGLRKWALLASCPKVSECDGTGVERILRVGRGMVVFQGMEGMFQPLLGHHALVRRRLEEMLTPSIRRLVEADRQRDCIAMHVRRGDMNLLAHGQLFPNGQCNRAQPIEWFAAVAQQLHAWLPGMPIRVFSDGTDDQLAPLLRLGGVARAPNNPSIVDILLMARARLLVPTSDSTFSMWSAYLGQLPAIWYPGESERPIDVGRRGVKIDAFGMISESQQRQITALALHPTPPDNQRPPI